MNEPVLAGRRALVTGSMGGLGAAMARALAEAGADVMLTGLEAPEAAEAARAKLAEAAGVRVAYARADLAQPAEIERLIAATGQTLGGLDILVNNAVVRHFAPIEAFPVERWDAALAINLSAAFHAIRLALPGMRAGGYGRIVNLTSVYGFRGTANRVDYVTTKTALQGLTRAVAMECLEGDVTCHALTPGAVLTPASEKRIQEMMAAQGLTWDEAEYRFLEGKGPSRRFVREENVARALLLVCGPAGRDMNGAILPIEGGWLAS